MGLRKPTEELTPHQRKVEHREHEINVSREESLAGNEMLFWSIFRASDGHECASGFEDSDETLDDMVENLKARVDNELAESDPWMESAKREFR